MNSDSPGPAGIPEPRAFASYRVGWRQMRAYFLDLLLLTAVYLVLTLPTMGLWGEDAAEFLSSYVSFNLVLFKISGTPGAILFSIAYAVLLDWPLRYGAYYASLKAIRGERPTVGTIFSAFRVYWYAVLAALLSAIIIIPGLIMLLVPGIYFIVKLIFVPYLVVDKRMEPVQAVKESWRLSRGHGFRIFGMLVLAVPIVIIGLLFFGVGVIVSIMWINLAFASLYHAVSERDTALSEVPPL